MYNDNDSYKFGHVAGPFYRKFLAGNNVWVEVNCDGQGGLWMNLGNSDETGTQSIESKSQSGRIHFSSEEHFVEFCTKLIGIDHNTFEEFWLKYG